MATERISMFEAGPSGSNNVDCSVHSPFLQWTVQLVSGPVVCTPRRYPRSSLCSAVVVGLVSTPRPPFHLRASGWSRLDCPQRPGRPLAVRPAQHFPMPPRCNAHQTGGTGGGPNPHEGCGAAQARDMSTRCIAIRSSRSRPPCALCPLERGVRRAHADWEAGGRDLRQAR